LTDENVQASDDIGALSTITTATGMRRGSHGGQSAWIALAEVLRHAARTDHSRRRPHSSRPNDDHRPPRWTGQICFRKEIGSFDVACGRQTDSTAGMTAGTRQTSADCSNFGPLPIHNSVNRAAHWFAFTRFCVRCRKIHRGYADQLPVCHKTSVSGPHNA